MGPGANAQADEIILAHSHPHVHFWNQPQQKNPSGSFESLIAAAEAEVKSLVSANGGSPIHVIAHSFGGHIFHHLSLRQPQLFKSCTFYGTGYDVPGGFFKLLKLMSQDLSTAPDLREKIKNYLSTQTNAKATEIWSYIGLIAQDPAFFRHYWPSENLFNSFAQAAAKTQPMHMESFQNILNDFLANHFTPDSLTPSPWTGRIEIQWGEKDPLIDSDHETRLWKAIFPQAHIKVLKNSGHFLHLEKYLNT